MTLGPAMDPSRSPGLSSCGDVSGQFLRSVKERPMQVHDVGIVGGGIVGLATASALMRQELPNLVVWEAESRPAAHQTGHNSGVIHSGLYYRPGSKKARTCVRGRQQLLEFCERREIPVDRCGKVVVATVPEQLPALQELERRGQANGLRGVKRLNAEQLTDHEPHVRGVAGLHVPETCIVSYPAVARALVEELREGGASVNAGARVVALERDASKWRVTTTAGEFAVRRLVNCAGLHADRVARLAGIKTGLQIVPFRGEYYRLREERAHLVRHLVYPVPDPRFPFLGVHFTRRIDGGVEAGPNAVLALRREGYRWRDVSLRDVTAMATFPGFWRMSLRYWRVGWDEVRRSLSKRRFVEDLRALIPELEQDDVEPFGSGVRAQAVDSKGHLIDDFRVEIHDHAVHVLNAPSPAATASLAIGEEIARLVETL